MRDSNVQCLPSPVLFLAGDAAAKAWRDRVIAAGGTASAYDVAAVSRYLRATAALPTPAAEIALFGGTLAAGIVLLRGTVSVSNVGFVNGDFSDADGINGGGKNGCYLEFGETLSNANPLTFGCYVRGEGTFSLSAQVWGARFGSAGNSVRFLSNSTGANWLPGSIAVNSLQGAISGSFTGGAGGTSKAFRRAEKVSQTTATPGTGTGPARAFSDPGGGTVVFAGMISHLVYWNTALSDADHQTWANAVQNLQSDWGRAM